VLLTQDVLTAQLESAHKQVVELSTQLEEKSRDLGQAKSDLDVFRRTSKVQFMQHAASFN